ncbi:MAG: hypothetical protein AB1352_05550 [Patescibacteria group bacterium]
MDDTNQEENAAANPVLPEEVAQGEAVNPPPPSVTPSEEGSLNVGEASAETPSPQSSHMAGRVADESVAEGNVRVVEKVVEKIIEKPVEVMKEVKVFDAAQAAEETRARLLGSRAAALQARRGKRDKKLEKILQRARERGRITNDEVQILIGTTDATARRYLVALASQGRLKKVGGEGRGVHYAPL